MALVLNGSTQYISCTSAVLTAAPLTVACRFNSTSAALGQSLIDLSNNTAVNINAFRMRAAGDVSATGRISTGDGTGTNIAVSTTTSYSASTWTTAMMVHTSTTSRDEYLDNAGTQLNVTSVVPTGINKTYIGVTNLNTVLSQFFSGSLCDIAFWSVALSAVDRARYQAGVSPFKIQRANLVCFLRLDQDLTDMCSAFTFTGTASPTFAASPARLQMWP